MRTFLVAAVLLLVAACQACTLGGAVSSPTGTHQTAVQPFEGEGDRASDPFELAGGNYRFGWSATASGDGCVFAVDLKPIDHEEFVSMPSFDIVPDAETKTGSAILDLDGGRYAWTVGGDGCSWSASLTPL